MLLKELYGLISSAERASCRFLSSDAKADSMMEYLLDDVDNHQLLFVLPATQNILVNLGIDGKYHKTFVGTIVFGFSEFFITFHLDIPHRARI